MSYTIYYGALNVKLSRNNKFIPMVLSGSNNVWMDNKTRARDWSNVQGGKGKLFFTADEYLTYTQHVIDTTEYLSDNRLYGKGNITPRKFINFAKKCIQNTITFEQAKECGIQIMWWDKSENFKHSAYIPKTEDELINFVNSDENKGKTLYIVFTQAYKANELCEKLSILNSFFGKKSEGKYCLRCTIENEENCLRYIGRDDNNMPILVDSYDKAFRFANGIRDCELIKALFEYIGNIKKCRLWTEQNEKEKRIA